jgi:hypothetical protein
MQKRVVNASMQEGQSIIRKFPSRWWELTLECGHVVERPVRYKNSHTTQRGWSWRLRSRADALKPVTRAKCDCCKK